MFKTLKRRDQGKKFQRELNLALGIKMEKFAEASAEYFISLPELEKIAKSKINPNYEKTNYQQQSGFAAEVKQVPRHNERVILEGRGDRIARTDNVGSVNHPKYDHVKVDVNGKPIVDSRGEYVGGSQQKNFSKISNYDKLFGKDYEHYKDTPIDVPSDHYDKILDRWNAKKLEYIKQKKYFQEQGRIDEANKISKKIAKVDDTTKRLRKSEVSSKDAMEARTNPKLSVAKDVGRISHKAGVEAAKGGAILGGAMSTFRNVKAIIDEDIDVVEGLQNIAVDTASTASKSYIAAAASSALGGALKASSNQFLKNLAKKSAPAAIVATAGILGKQVLDLISDKITADEFVKNVGEEGFALASSMTGANWGAAIGTAIVPGLGTVVGGLLGGMIASMLSSAAYNGLMAIMNDAKISEERRKLISAYCAKLKQEEIRYRNELVDTLNQFYSDKENQIKNGFDSISHALSTGKDINPGLKEVAQAFNIELAFANTEEMTKHIRSGKVLEL